MFRRRHQILAVAAVAAAAVTAGALVGTDGAGVSAADESRTLSYLRGIGGYRTIAGQLHGEPGAEPSRWSDRARELTGAYPGLWGGDLRHADTGQRAASVAEAKQQARAGALVTLSWDACPPTGPDPCPGAAATHLDDERWRELVTAGTPLNTEWKRRLDGLVPYLRDLRDSGVEVLWRPVHELNDARRWWGGRPGPDGSRRLYQVTHDHLAAQGLTNLVWVWNVRDVDDARFVEYYPGDGYVDVVSLDAWNRDFPTAQTYDALRVLAPGKPLGLAEVGRLPSPTELATQPGWSYFAVLGEHLTSHNPPAAVRATYGDERVLTREEIDLAAPPPTGNVARGKPVRVSSTDGDHRPAHLVDGATGTGWHSDDGDPQWAAVDLGQAYRIGRVRLHWESGYARKYQIQFSDDGQRWTAVYHDYAGDGGIDEIVVDGTTRYVRLYAWERGVRGGYAVSELEAHLVG
jgi:mannan endo-1,4-beta-mannosidase